MIKQTKFILLSFLLGTIFSLIFVEKLPGISYPLFVMALTGLLAYSLHKTGKLEKDYNWLFLIPIMLLSFRYFLSRNMILAVLNAKVIFTLFVGMAILLVGKKAIDWGSFKFIGKIILQILKSVGFFFKPYTQLYDNLSFIKESKWKRTAAKVIVALLISSPALLLIVGLLSSADAVFGHMIEFIPQMLEDWFEQEDIALAVSKVFVAVVVGTYIYSFGYVLHRDYDKEEEVPNNETKKRTDVDSVIMITILGVINVVYILFSVIQFSYLFAGNGALPGGLTYSEYARQGFMQLIVVTVINFSIILASLYTIDNKTEYVRKAIKTLLLLISAATFVMLYSSFFRMSLYQQNYGYTYLRIFVNAFLIFEAIALAGTAYYILRKSFNLMKMYIVTFLICYTVLNYINIDKMVAKSNIDMYFETGKIDVMYLTMLSTDAVPQMERLLGSKDPNVVTLVKQYFITSKKAINARQSWVEYNFADYEAKKILEKLK